MNIYVYKPKNESNKIGLEVAKIHAQSIKKYLDTMKCNKEQKIQLLTEVMLTN